MTKAAKYARATTPKPMRFQKRDGKILAKIQAYDGFLSRQQVKSIFWPQAATQAMERRLSLLFHNGYLNWPDTSQRRTKPIPEPIVWLGWRGILHIAAQNGVDVKPPLNEGENQMRLLERRLREKGVRWQREPRWSQLSHDIAVNDFRWQVEQAVNQWPSIALETWLSEGDFLREMDVVEIAHAGQNGMQKKRRKGVRPDGYFILVDQLRKSNNLPAKARFLLEFDNSNHSLTRFGKDKVLPGVAYVRSPVYKARFGFNAGRWLVVCYGRQRLLHLKAITEKTAGANASLFLFTTMGQVKPETVLNAPIWLRGGSDKVEQLVKPITAGS